MVDYNEVDLIFVKIGLNLMNLSNIKFKEGMGVFVFESFCRKLCLDCNWKKDVLKSVELFIKECV